MSSPTLIVIAGPTAVGKTRVAIELAKAFKTEIISADSRQFYTEMSIGTAKPTSKELATVKHHFINSHSVTDPVNAGRYERECISLLRVLFEEKKVLILTGGSGLFIDAICKGLDELPTENKRLREELNERLHIEGLGSLVDELRALDPEFCKTADLKNPHRVIRAMEVCLQSGQPYSSQRNSKPKDRFFESIKICLNMDRALLYKRINQRVDEMIKDGLVEEAKSLIPYKEISALKTVGYREVFEHLDNQFDLDRCISLIKQNTRRYAKRQVTWFKRDNSYKWYTPDQFETISDYLKTKISK